MPARGAIQIRSFVSGFANNAYFVSDARQTHGFIVDAPESPQQLLAAIHSSGVEIQFILITHGHWDHIMGLRTLLDQLDVPVVIGAGDADAIEQYQPREGVKLTEDTELPTALSLPVSAKLTPGHTPGSVCYYLAGGAAEFTYMTEAGSVAAKSGVLFAGDTLFPNGPGKTQTRADFVQITESLERQVFSLPADTLVLTGHGTYTDIGTSVDEYRQFQAREDGTEYGEVQWITSRRAA